MDPFLVIPVAIVVLVYLAMVCVWIGYWQKEICTIDCSGAWVAAAGLIWPLAIIIVLGWCWGRYLRSHP
jgi:hypothetical protein